MKRILGAIALSVALLGVIPLHHASASIGGCRVDPVLTVWPGPYKLYIETDVADSASNVSSGSYTVHVPTGVTGASFMFSGDFPESGTVVKDQPTGTYVVDAYITDGANTVSITDTSTLKNGLGTITYSTVQTPGTTNETVQTNGIIGPGPLGK